jgi:hypothetical protein
MSAELQADIAELSMRATRRLGEISTAMEKAKGNQYKKVECPNNRQSKTATLSSVGISRQRANEAEKIAKIPEKDFENRIALAKAATQRITKSLFTSCEIAENFVLSYVSTTYEPTTYKQVNCN